MSALPLKADTRGAIRHVGFGQKADIIIASFDRLVGTGEYCLRNCEAQCLSGLEVDNQLVLGRGLYRHVGRLLTLEDAINVARSPAVLVDVIRPVGDQTAIGDV